MKKSRITKLALSGAAVAALAATFSTSTYAWYVSNKTATVDTVYGATSAGQADGSILISWDNETDSYYKTLSWTDSNAPQITTLSGGKNVFDEGLSPVYYNATANKFQSFTTYKKTEDTALDGTKTYYTNSDSTFTAVDEPNVASIGSYYELEKEVADLSTGYVQFSMYIKADKANTTVTITPSLANTTTSVSGLKQIAYVDTGSNVTQGESFVVDAFDAMYYSVAQGTSAPFAVVAAPTSGKMAAGMGAKKPAAAHTYYEAVTGEVLETKYKTEPTTTALSSITVGTDPIKLTYTIWLAGNDVDCYNSCAGQSFSFSITYKA